MLCFDLELEELMLRKDSLARQNSEITVLSEIVKELLLFLTQLLYEYHGSKSASASNVSSVKYYSSIPIHMIYTLNI